MPGARTFYAANEQLRKLRRSAQGFGAFLIILFCGHLYQLRPVWGLILLPSAVFLWDAEKTFRMEQRPEHGKWHALWNKFTTVVIPERQVRAVGGSAATAADPHPARSTGPVQPGPHEEHLLQRWLPDPMGVGHPHGDAAE